MRQLLLAGLTALGLGLFDTPARAQSVFVNPMTGASVQYYTPHAYGPTTYYYGPNTSYMYAYPPSGYGYTSNYVGPTVYGPGYTANYPYMYNQLNYGNYYYPGYTSYRTYRWWR